ncbi:MAG: long-chain fatty acid--CoA ligase, partial [Chitinophagales bacterium]|nr:long-chain fatty acid--CoA ligase [Chitinophagales bacterium]
MEVKRLFDSLYYQQENHPQKIALAQYKNGQLETYSTDDLVKKANQMSLGLLQLGIQKGDKVAT